jgi:hypothetical protein
LSILDSRFSTADCRLPIADSLFSILNPQMIKGSKYRKNS